MYNKCQKAALAAAIALAPAMATGASFQLLEQSPAQLGKAFAGTASDAADATTVYFNPAAMSELKGNHATVGLNVVATDAQFTADADTTYPGPDGATEEYGLVPNLYSVTPVGDNFSLGFGISAPYGLSSSFDDEWVGRYSATDSSMEVTNVNITSSWSVNDVLSLGLGVNYQMMEATLENQVDSTFGVAPDPSTDSSARIEGDDDDFVLDASVFFNPAPGTRLGLVWRQGGEFTLDGTAEFDYNAACSPGAGFPTGAPPAPTTGTLCAGGLAMLEGPIRASVELPDTITASYSQHLTDAWALHLDVAQTQWSSIQNIVVVNTDTGATVDTLDLRYDDTMRYALGTTLQMSETLTWRAGVALDNAPQTNPEHVTPRIPDADRTWLSFGANWALSDSLSLDMSYTHLLIDDASLVEVDETSGRQLSGSFDSAVDIVGAQLNWRW